MTVKSGLPSYLTQQQVRQLFASISTTYAQISDARRNRTMRRFERSREFPIPS